MVVRNGDKGIVRVILEQTEDSLRSIKPWRRANRNPATQVTEITLLTFVGDKRRFKGNMTQSCRSMAIMDKVEALITVKPMEEEYPILHNMSNETLPIPGK